MVRRHVGLIDYVARKQSRHLDIAVKVAGIASTDACAQSLATGCSKYGGSTLLALQGTEHTVIIIIGAVASHAAQSERATRVIGGKAVGNALPAYVIPTCSCVAQRKGHVVGRVVVINNTINF